MKKYYFGILAILLIIAGCTEDADKWSDVQRDMDVGGAIPYIQFTSPRIFDIKDLNSSALNFKLNVGASGQGKNFTEVNLYKSFNGGAFVLHKTYASSEIPAEISISVEEALQGIPGVTVDSIVGGDVIDWAWEMVFPDYIVNTFDTITGGELIESGVPLVLDEANNVHADSNYWFDGPNGVYNGDAAGTFPDFAAFFATSTEGFTIDGSYTMKILQDDLGTAVSEMSGYAVDAIGGTANSQYLLEDISATALLPIFGITVAYRIHYIGNNTFALNAGSEGWPGLIRLSGSVTWNPDTGVLLVDAVYAGSCCGLDGAVIKYELIPE
jgi:hypothetical protein